jgi:DNA repair exonuclease SbcCD ATPase subunit
LVPYTLADRDRAIRSEARMETLEAKVDALDKRIDNVQLQLNRLEDKFDSYFMWGFGLVLMSIFVLIGFIIYDRRTTLAPVESKTERIIKALKEASEKDPVLREALKKTALW